MTDDEKLELDYYRILASKSMKAKVADLIAHHKQTRKQPRKPKKYGLSLRAVAAALI